MHDQPAAAGNCPHCRFGMLQPATLTYVRPWGGQVITLSKAPAFRCRVCGYMEEDEQFNQWVEKLLRASTPTRRVPRPHQRPARPWTAPAEQSILTRK